MHTHKLGNLYTLARITDQISAEKSIKSCRYHLLMIQMPLKTAVTINNCNNSSSNNGNSSKNSSNGNINSSNSNSNCIYSNRRSSNNSYKSNSNSYNSRRCRKTAVVVPTILVTAVTSTVAAAATYLQLKLQHGVTF